MSKRWFYVTGPDGYSSLASVVADDATERGFTVQSVDIPDGKVPSIVDGRLVAADPPAPVAPRSLRDEIRSVVTEELDRRG